MILRYTQAIIAALLLLSTFSVNAQTTISGTVSDGAGQPIVSGNVLVISLPDSALVTGEAFWDGTFELSYPAATNGFLKVTALGMRDTTLALAAINSGQPLTITLQANALKEVQITALKPAFKNEGDMLIVNVEESALSGAGTALDVLRNTPGVRVTGSNAVSILGRGTPTLFMDGQPISVDMLQSISSEDIVEIEVIKNPSAKYDAQGRAVINIITKASMQEGYHINYSSHTTKSTWWRSWNGLRANYRKGKVNVTGRYGVYRGDLWQQEEFWRDFDNNGTPISLENKVVDRERGLAQYYGAAINYHPDSVNRLGVSFRGFNRNNRTGIDNTNLVTFGGVQSLIATTTDSDANLGNSVLGINHHRKLDTLKSSLTTTAEYSRYTSTLNDAIFESITEGTTTEISKRNLNSNYINILSARTDLVKNTASKWTFETGLKYANIFNTSDIVFDRQNAASEWVNNPQSSNDFDYDEKIGAGYLQLQKKLGNFTLRGGVRAEYTQSYGFSNAQNSAVVDTSYFNLFPNAKLSWKLMDDLNWITTYSYRINRPSYQDLDPFLDYLDSLSAFQGNPRLVPEYTHSIASSLVFMEYASLDLEYARTENSMNLFVQRVDPDENQFVAQTRNFDFSEQYSLGIVLPYETDHWTTYNGFGYQWNTFQYAVDDETITFARPMWYFFLYDEITMPKLFNIEGSLEYYGAGIEGMFDYDAFWQAWVSVNRNFFDGKLNVRLSAEDIFTSYVEKGASFLPNYEIRYRSQYDRHLYRVSLKYNFGKLRKLDVKQASAADDERNRIKQD